MCEGATASSRSELLLRNCFNIFLRCSRESVINRVNVSLGVLNEILPPRDGGFVAMPCVIKGGSPPKERRCFYTERGGVVSDTSSRGVVRFGPPHIHTRCIRSSEYSQEES